MYSFLRIIFLIACIPLLITACDGEGLKDGLLISWNANPEPEVNRAGGGYKVYYSTTSGFNPGDVDVTVVDIPYVSGATAPTTADIPVVSGIYYIRVAAYSSLNTPGSSGDSISAATPEITLVVP